MEDDLRRISREEVQSRCHYASKVAEAAKRRIVPGARVSYVGNGGISFPRGATGTVMSVDRFCTVEWMPDDPAYRPPSALRLEGVRGWTHGNHFDFEALVVDYEVSWG